jgi:hypothetical protein
MVHHNVAGVKTMAVASNVGIQAWRSPSSTHGRLWAWAPRTRSGSRDGAFGPSAWSSPKDAVLTVLSGVSTMQAVLNLARERLLPATADDVLPRRPRAARDRPEQRLTALTHRRPSGGVGRRPTAARVSGRSFRMRTPGSGSTARRVETFALDAGPGRPAPADRGRAGSPRGGRGSWRLAAGSYDSARRRGRCRPMRDLDRRWWPTSTDGAGPRSVPRPRAATWRSTAGRIV